MTCSRLRDLMRRQLFALDRGPGRPLLAQQEPRDALVVTEHERTQHHRQDQRHQQRLTQAGRDRAGLQADGAQSDTELTADGDHDAGAQRLESGSGKRPGHECGHRRLQHVHAR